MKYHYLHSFYNITVILFYRVSSKSADMNRIALPHEQASWPSCVEKLQAASFSSLQALSPASLSAFICRMALEIETLFLSSEDFNYLKENEQRVVVLTQRKALCLLCHAFLGTLPEPHQDFSGQHLKFEFIQITSLRNSLVS